jgi:hypothetical protein
VVLAECEQVKIVAQVPPRAREDPGPRTAD